MYSSASFERLVLGGINADFWNKALTFLHLSKSTRCTHLHFFRLNGPAARRLLLGTFAPLRARKVSMCFSLVKFRGIFECIASNFCVKFIHFCTAFDVISSTYVFSCIFNCCRLIFSKCSCCIILIFFFHLHFLLF